MPPTETIVITVQTNWFGFHLERRPTESVSLQTKRFLHECGEEEKIAVYQQFANAHCPVLYEHFTRTYTEPSAWLSARQVKYFVGDIYEL